MEVRRAPSEVEGGSPSELMVCAPSEEMRGVFHDPGEVTVGGGRRCLDSTLQDMCNLEVGVDDRGPKR